MEAEVLLIVVLHLPKVHLVDVHGLVNPPAVLAARHVVGSARVVGQCDTIDLTRVELQDQVIPLLHGVGQVLDVEHLSEELGSHGSLEQACQCLFVSYVCFGGKGLEFWDKGGGRVLESCRP